MELNSRRGPRRPSQSAAGGLRLVSGLVLRVLLTELKRWRAMRQNIGWEATGDQTTAPIGRQCVGCNT
jgi:hypothetical protein